MYIFLLLNSALILLLSKMILCMVLALLNLLRRISWSSTGSILVNFPSALGERQYLLLLGGWRILWMSVRSSWLIALFRSSYVSTDFCQLSREWVGSKKIYNYNCEFVHFSFQLCHFLIHLFFEALLLHISIIKVVVSSSWTNPSIITKPLW